MSGSIRLSEHGSMWVERERNIECKSNQPGSFTSKLSTEAQLQAIAGNRRLDDTHKHTLRLRLVQVATLFVIIIIIKKTRSGVKILVHLNHQAQPGEQLRTLKSPQHFPRCVCVCLWERQRASESAHRKDDVEDGEEALQDDVDLTHD